MASLTRLFLKRKLIVFLLQLFNGCSDICINQFERVEFNLWSRKYVPKLGALKKKVKMESCVNQSNIYHESKSNASNYENETICIENGPKIIMQSSVLANDQCMVPLVFIMTMVVVFYRATASASISKDDSSMNSMAYLFKDFVLILKSLHWKNFDYWRIVFIGSCFILFIILFPIFLCLWFVLLSYRQYIHHVIKVS